MPHLINVRAITRILTLALTLGLLSAILPQLSMQPASAQPKPSASASLIAAPAAAKVIDCRQPQAGIFRSKHHGLVFVSFKGHVLCTHRPTEIHAQMNLQKEVKGRGGHRPPHWEYRQFTRIYDGLNPRSMTLNVPEHDHTCTLGKWRSAIQVWGISSTGEPESGQTFCSDPLTIGQGGCTFSGNRGRRVRIHPDTHPCDPLPSPVFRLPGRQAAMAAVSAVPHVFGHALGSDCLPPQTGLYQHRNKPPHAFEVDILGHGILRCKQRPESITSQLCLWQKFHHVWSPRECSRFKHGLNRRLEQRIGLRELCHPDNWQTEWDFWNLRTSSGVPNPPESHCSDVVHFGCNPPARTVRRLLNPKRTHICVPHGDVPPAGALAILAVPATGAVLPGPSAAGRDCKNPVLSYYKHWNARENQWQKFATFHIFCPTEPRQFNWQMNTQQWHKNKGGGGHWEYYKFNKQHHPHPPGHHHSDSQVTKCSPGTFRTAVQIWGISSAGIPESGDTFCTEPGFKIRSCAPAGPGRGRPRPHHKAGPHVTGQKTVKCDPLPAGV